MSGRHVSPSARSYDKRFTDVGDDGTRSDDCEAPAAGTHPTAGVGRTPRPALAALARLAALVRSARSVVALTGAGISVPSGIPDFRSPGSGLWANVDPMQVAHIDAFHRDPARFWGFYAQRFATLEGKQPNDAHRALVAMERCGLLDAVITQNVDMLHRKAGTRELVEVHGSIATCSCLRCGRRVPLAQARALLDADPQGVPRCRVCGDPIKPDVVLFGEMLPAAAIARAQQLCEGADVLLCVGSSLEVHPVAGLPLLTREAGGAIAVITQGPTPLDDIAEVRLSGDVVAELQALVGALDATGLD
jgi:NAD-dependent deacetylase